jgi:NAD(P)-dependent dehydrogenase (short-subunit alcohol dehydrogenase family)
VTDEGSVTEAAAELERHEGRIDVLINNAGIREPGMSVGDDGVPQPFMEAADLTGPDAMEVFETNVFGVVRVTHAFLPLLEKSEHPVIVNVSSGMGSFAAVTDPERGESQVSVPLYSASKSALTMLTVQYAKLLPGMRVNAADPGLTATDFNGGQGTNTVAEGADAIVGLSTVAADGSTGSFVDRYGLVNW